MTQKYPITWSELVVQAVTQADGIPHLKWIYEKVAFLRKEAGLPLSATWRNTIRRTLQQSKAIRPVPGKPGYWGLADRVNPPSTL